MNDIRATLGAIRNRVNEINDRLQRIDKFAEFTEWVDQQINALPEKVDGIITRLESDPMLGTLVAPILGPQLRELAAEIKKRRDNSPPEPAE